MHLVKTVNPRGGFFGNAPDLGQAIGVPVSVFLKLGLDGSKKDPFLF